MIHGLEERRYNCNIEEAKKKPVDLNLNWKYNCKLMRYFTLENTNVGVDIYTT